MPTHKPLPRKQRVINRGYLYSRSGDDIKNPTVTLMDMDSAIIHYFEKVIKPSVEDNGENIKVPIMYASPERWKSVQRDGFMRDKKRQIITPIIAYRRTSVEKDDSIPQDKLDANNPHMFYTFEKKFSNINRYDNFSKQIGLLPQKEYYNVTFPDYVTLTYDFIIWTTYIEQMNKIVERITYSDGAYWGDPDKMRFRTRVESFSDATEVSDAERFVKTTFTVTLRGYLLPEGNFDHRGTLQKYMTPKKVVFSTDVDSAVTKTAGRAGSFLEEVLESRQFSIPGGLDPETFGISLAYPLVFSAGTGVTLSSNNVSFDGSARVEQRVSIGQPVGITDSVTFNQVSASSLTLGSTTYDGGSITGNLIITGSVTTTGNMTVNGNTTITGTLTAQEYHTEFVSASIIYASGSTKFGDTLDDNHNFTGSLLTTGSLSLNDYSVTEISNDILLADSSTTSLVTENAIKTFVDAQTVTKQTYLRKQYFKTNSTIIIPATASFSAVTASAPPGMVATSEHDFIFFINGQYMEHDAIEIEQSGSLFLLQVDNASIGYDLETDDEIIAIGKFNS